MKNFFMLLMSLMLLPVSTALAGSPSPRIEVGLGAPDGRGVDQPALDKILAIVAKRVARGEVTQMQSDYGIEGDLYLCLGFDWSSSDPAHTAPVRAAVLKELRAVPLTPGSGNQKSVEAVDKCSVPPGVR